MTATLSLIVSQIVATLALVLSRGDTGPADVYAPADDPVTVVSEGSVCTPNGYLVVFIVSDAYEDEAPALFPAGRLVIVQGLLTDMDSDGAKYRSDYGITVFDTDIPCERS